MTLWLLGPAGTNYYYYYCQIVCEQVVVRWNVFSKWRINYFTPTPLYRLQWKCLANAINHMDSQTSGMKTIWGQNESRKYYSNAEATSAAQIKVIKLNRSVKLWCWADSNGDTIFNVFVFGFGTMDWVTHTHSNDIDKCVRKLKSPSSGFCHLLSICLWECVRQRKKEMSEGNVNMFSNSEWWF